jgi:purine-binding chemotaxis protein CheW
MVQPENERTAAGNHAGGPQTYTTFRLRGGLFGTATSVVKEVTALPPLTPIPHAPAAVRGYVNLRGHIVLVVDLNCLLRREPMALGPDSRLVVFQPDLGDAFGVMVERIGDIVALSAEQIETHHAGNAASGSELSDWPAEELICGVGKLDGELLSILDARRLRPCLECAVAARGAVVGGNRREPDDRSAPPKTIVTAS